MNFQHALVLVGASALAGAVNSVAGGGTLLTFSALLWTGVNPVVANATSTVALWPGQLSSLWGYRKEIGDSRAEIVKLGVPSLIGGYVGAHLLLHTPPSVFGKVVPYLILGATMLFMVQEPLARAQRRRERAAAEARAAAAEGAVIPAPDAIVTDAETAGAAANGSPLPAVIDEKPRSWIGVMLFQLGVAIYGGYFGAGIGILMLAALGFMGFTNIHRMNGLKNLNGLCINAVAAVMFIATGLVKWHIALMMASGSMFGGYFGSGAARRIGQRNVRRIIIGIGFALTLFLLRKSP